jgi:hypothetical protein
MPAWGSVTHRFTARYNNVQPNGESLFNGEFTRERWLEGDDAAAADAAQAQAVAQGECLMFNATFLISIRQVSDESFVNDSKHVIF